MKNIVLQGDSITDCQRSRDGEEYRGSGYATLIASKLNLEYPGRYTVYNRGIGGDKSVGIYARLQKDVFNLKPDYLSILVGVNDAWHMLPEISNGVSAKRYEKAMNLILEETKEQFPTVKFIVMSPFLLKASHTLPEWDFLKREVDLRAEAAFRVASKYDAEFISLGQIFDDALKKAPEENWVIDGVHPKAAGHALIADAWLKVFDKIER
ncbi:MAG: SGNH/GDSL hydrolase family protein [Bacillota bacterium]|nr:SGNH/GDSL hydrolase family protein [Bacillota bacterium]